MLRHKLFLVPPGFKWKNLNHWLAFGLGSGLIKRAPGTWGSLAALFIYGLLLAHSPIALWVLIVGGFFLGITACANVARDLGVHDHGAIVWDEFIGQWLALAFLQVLGTDVVDLANMALAFVLFRLFDIIKPWPISWADRRVQGGLGIMLDDVFAGLFAGLSLCLVNLMVSL